MDEKEMALHILSEAKITQDTVEAEKLLQMQAEQFGLDLAKYHVDLRYAANVIVEEKARQNLEDYFGIPLTFFGDNTGITVSQDSLIQIREILQEKEAMHSEYSFENDEKLSDTARYVLRMLEKNQGISPSFVQKEEKS